MAASDLSVLAAESTSTTYAVYLYMFERTLIIPPVLETQSPDPNQWDLRRACNRNLAPNGEQTTRARTTCLIRKSHPNGRRPCFAIRVVSGCFGILMCARSAEICNFCVQQGAMLAFAVRKNCKILKKSPIFLHSDELFSHMMHAPCLVHAHNVHQQGN